MAPSGGEGRLDGRVVVVTGAAQGIGAAVARQVHLAGGIVACCDIQQAKVASVAADIGAPSTHHDLDVASEPAWQVVRDEILDRHGRVDALVNNAAILRYGSLSDLPVDEYMQMVMVNQVGCYLGMRAFAADLGVRGGAIVNMSSAMGLVGMADFVGYAATKFAIRGMTKAAAAELGPSNVRVNSVHPTGVRTEMSDPARFGVGERDTSRIPLRRLSSPVEVARLVVFLLSDESSYCTGSEFVIDGGVLSQQP